MFGGALFAPALAAGLPRIASMNVCTDQLLIPLADPRQILEKILPRYLEFSIFKILLESAGGTLAAGRIDARGASSWDPAGYDSGDEEQRRDRGQRDGIVGGDAPELRGDYARYGEAGDYAEDDPAANEAETHADYEAEDMTFFCT